MKTRTVTIFTGTTFEVPQRIQRIGHQSHPWLASPLQRNKVLQGRQCRWNWRRAVASGRNARTDQTLGHPHQRLLCSNAVRARTKTSGLPPGISGPIVARRSEQSGQTASLSVLIPRFGETNQIKSIYIASEATYTGKKFKAALAKAVEMRTEAVARYEEAAAKAMRQEASALRQSLRQGQKGGA